jgi:hypothetical protein
MNKKSRRGGGAVSRAALLLAVTMVAGTARVEGQEIRWTGSTSYSTGSYIFDTRTHSFTLSNGLGLSWGRFDLNANLPVLMQNSGVVSLVGGVPLPTGGENNGAVGRRQPGETIGTGGSGGGGGMGSGAMSRVAYADAFSLEVGDPLLSGALRLYEGTGFVRSVQIQGSSKPPLRGLESGVGTGEWDFGAGASAFASLATGTYLFADLSYWWYGDLPELELTDGLSYGLGISRAAFDSRGSILVSFLGADTIIETMERPMSLGLGASYSLESGQSVSGGLTFGLTESSPDFSVYAGWSVGL